MAHSDESLWTCKVGGCKVFGCEIVWVCECVWVEGGGGGSDQEVQLPLQGMVGGVRALAVCVGVGGAWDSDGNTTQS